MNLPITEEFLQEFEAKMKTEEGNPITEHRKTHARIVAKIINQAYSQGITEGIILAKKGVIKL